MNICVSILTPGEQNDKRQRKKRTNEQGHSIYYKISYAHSENSDQSAYPILWVVKDPKRLQVESNYSD